QSEAIGRHVAGDDAQPASHHGVELAAEIRAKAVEGVVAEDLALDALGGRRPATAPHEQDDLAVGNAAQQPLDDRGAEEAGPPGDGDSLFPEALGDHRTFLAGRLPFGK
ncbi:MAG: hypothetical protein QOD72_430, partial [Acidimicrobiaceae bacterium]|nr:hypothetical protein [Acidimicrobiaceae bacterium]